MMTGDSMTTTQRVADIISGIFLAVVGIAVILATWDLESAFGERLPPRTLPLVTRFNSIISGALLAVRSYLLRGEDLGFSGLTEKAGCASWLHLSL